MGIVKRVIVGGNNKDTNELEKDYVEIVIIDGMSILVYKDQLFRTDLGWKKASELKKGVKIYA